MNPNMFDDLVFIAVAIAVACLAIGALIGWALS